MNTFFQSQTYLDDQNKQLPEIHLDPNDPILDHLAVSEGEVADILNSLSLGKATGPDNVNNKILKELCQELANPLCKLFNTSLQTGKVPSQWKLAHVCAVYKKNDPHTVSNYRPISLLSTVSKVLEKIIHKHVS